ncbi:hypothetical protein KQH54_00160 [bacterium]|nr:hypothetical protein [bacterium]
MQSKKIAFTLFVMVLVFALLAGCGPTEDQGNTGQNAQSGNQTPTQEAETPTEDASGDMAGDSGESTGDEVVFSPFDYASLDPAYAGEGDADLLAASNMLYDTLVDVVEGEVVAGLAAEWSASEDGLTYRFNLRPDAVFTDGTPVTTDVVMANFNRWYYPDNALHGEDGTLYQAWLTYFKGFWMEPQEDTPPDSLFDGIEKVDELEFLIHLYEPIDNFLEVIAMPQFSILNPSVLEAEGADYGTMAGSVVGTGAYMVSSWDDSGLTLVPSDTYWGN